MKNIIKNKKAYDLESYWIKTNNSLKEEYDYFNRLDVLKSRNTTRSVADIEREIARLEAERTAELKRQEQQKKVWFDYEASFDEGLLDKFKRYYKKIENE